MKYIEVLFATLIATINVDAKSDDITKSKVRSSPSCLRDPWIDDTVVTLVPKFKIKPEFKDEYMALLPEFTKLVEANEKDSAVFYGFVGPTEDGYVICREGYISGEAVLNHLDNVGDVLSEALKYSDLVDLMVQGPAEELEILKEPIEGLGGVLYPLEPGAISWENKCV